MQRGITGQIADRLGKLELIAGRLARRPEALRPDHGDLFRHLGAIYLASGEAPKAVPKLEMALRCNPADESCLELLAQALGEVGRPGDAALAQRVLDKLRARPASTSAGTDRRRVRRPRRQSRPNPDRGEHRRRARADADGLALDDVSADEPVAGAVVARRSSSMSEAPTVRAQTAHLVVEAVADSRVVDPADPRGVALVDVVGDLVGGGAVRELSTASVSADHPGAMRTTKPTAPVPRATCEDMGGRFSRALVLKNAALLDEAIAELRVVVRSESYASAAYTVIGHCLLDKGDPRGAAAAFLAAVVQTRDPGASQVLRRLVRAAFDLADGREA